jgi:hypothetical protein
MHHETSNLFKLGGQVQWNHPKLVIHPHGLATELFSSVIPSNKDATRGKDFIASNSRSVGG